MSEDRRSKYNHLWQICLWLGILLIPLTLITGWHQYKLLFTPFDLNQLKDEEVMFFEHGSGRQLYAMKLITLANRNKPDVIITGNHSMRHFSGSKHLKNLDFFNFVVGGPSVFQELDLLKALKKIDRLPKKVLIFTLLAHGGSDRLLNRDQLFFSNGDIEAPFHMSLKNVGNEFEWFFTHKNFLNALASIAENNMVVNSSDCERSYRSAERRKFSIGLRLRMKFAEYASPYTALNSGLISLEDYCRDESNFKTLNYNGFIKNGGMLDTYRPELAYHRVYDYPVLTPAAAMAAADEVLRGIQQLENFAQENGFRIVYLIPPRYEIPLNGPNDDVANLVFERNAGLTVIDFRRYALDKKYYIDDAHMAEDFGEILAPCLRKIISSPLPLQSRPAVQSRGRTVC